MRLFTHVTAMMMRTPYPMCARLLTKLRVAVLNAFINEVD